MVVITRSLFVIVIVRVIVIRLLIIEEISNYIAKLDSAII